MLLAIAASLIGRAVAITLLTPLLDRNDWNLLIGGGLRGAVIAALALSLPVELEGWWTAQVAAYAVVIFTLFIQAPRSLCGCLSAGENNAESAPCASVRSLALITLQTPINSAVVYIELK